MDEVFARRDLIEPAALRALCTRSDHAGLLQLGSHLAAIGVTGAGIAATLGTLWVVPVFVLHGVLINFLYAAQHETSHYTAFRSRWLNAAVGRTIGFFLLYPRDFDQIQHYAHHRHTQDWARDGELERPPYGRDELPALAARRDLLDQPGGAHPPFRARQGERELYPAGAPRPGDPRGALARGGIRADRRRSRSRRAARRRCSTGSRRCC